MRLLGLTLLAFACANANANNATGAAGVDVRYERYGTGTSAIVFVHGWTCDGTYWRNQVDAFAGEYTVVTIDLGGHGDSGINRDDWSMAAFGEDVAAVVEAADLDKVVLVGHSMGGAVVIEAAQLLRERVQLVVAVDTLQEPTRLPYSEEESFRLWAPFRDDFAPAMNGFVRRNFFLASAPSEIIDWVASDMASADAGIALAAGHALTTWNVPEGLASISDIPFVLINADYRPTDAVGLREVHPDARLILIPDVGHFPMLVRPESFNAVLRQILPAPSP